MTTTPTTPATVDLLPCPFCGEPARFIESEGGFEVGCSGCDVKLPTWHFTEASVASAWNRRAIDRRGGVDQAMIDRAKEIDPLDMEPDERVREILEYALGQAQGGGT